MKGRQLVDGSGRTVQLRSVNRAVFEGPRSYDDTGFNDGRIDQASVSAMRSWKITPTVVGSVFRSWIARASRTASR